MRVIVLNGIGSVGKSSTARAIQAIASKPFLHVAMDAFLAMLPVAMLDHPDGLRFEESLGEGGPVVAVRSGAVLDRATRGMRHAVAALAGQGNDVIVGEVMIGPGAAREYRELLRAHELRLVGGSTRRWRCWKRGSGRGGTGGSGWPGAAWAGAPWRDLRPGGGHRGDVAGGVRAGDLRGVRALTGAAAATLAAEAGGPGQLVVR